MTKKLMFDKHDAHLDTCTLVTNDANTVSIISIQQNCLNVDEAVKAHSNACLAVRFLADTSVLYEISCFGLNDSSKEVMIYYDLFSHDLVINSKKYFLE